MIKKLFMILVVLLSLGAEPPAQDDTYVLPPSESQIDVGPVDPPDPPGTIQMDWNPGHYNGYGMTRSWATNPNAAPPASSEHLARITGWQNSQFCSVIANQPKTKGVMIKIHWRNIVYDRYTDRNYDVFDDWYDAVKTQCGGNKRLGIMIKGEAENENYYGPTCAGVTGACTNSGINGGVNKTTGRRACAPQQAWDDNLVVWDETAAGSPDYFPHCMPALWNTTLWPKFRDFLMDFGAYLNTKPLVEWISFEGEGSKGWVMQADDKKGATQALVTKVYKDALITLRAAAPNKFVALGTNHFDPNVNWPVEILQTCQNMRGCGFMWPDTHAADTALWPHSDAHQYYCANSGKIALFGGLEALTKSKRIFPLGPEYSAPLEALYDHCCDKTGQPIDNNGHVDGYCHTHPWWRQGSFNGTAGLTDSDWINRITQNSLGVYSVACPTNVTANGGVCVTGRLN